MKAYPKELRNQDFDWLDDARRLGVTQNYYASASANLKKITFLTSLD